MDVNLHSDDLFIYLLNCILAINYQIHSVFAMLQINQNKHKHQNNQFGTNVLCLFNVYVKVLNRFQHLILPLWLLKTAYKYKIFNSSNVF